MRNAPPAAFSPDRSTSPIVLLRQQRFIIGLRLIVVARNLANCCSITGAMFKRDWYSLIFACPSLISASRLTISRRFAFSWLSSSSSAALFGSNDARQTSLEPNYCY